MFPPQDPDLEHPREPALVVREVPWNLVDVVGAITVTMLSVVTILNITGALGSASGFETSIGSPQGFIVGLAMLVIGVVVLRVLNSPLWPMVGSVGFAVVVIAISYSLASETSTGDAQIVGVPVSIIAATAMSGTFAAIGMAFSIINYRQPLSSLGFVRTSGIKPYVYAAGMWIIAVTSLMVWLQLLVWLDVSQLLPPDTASEALDSAGGNIVITVILVGLIGPFAEEVFFRGFMLSGLVKRFGTARSLIISSLVFGVFHIDPGAIVPTFVLGLALGWVYLKTGSIWPAIFGHGLHNTIAVLIAKYADVG